MADSPRTDRVNGHAVEDSFDSGALSPNGHQGEDKKRWFADPKRITDYAVLSERVTKLNDELLLVIEERESLRQKYEDAKAQLDLSYIRQGANSDNDSKVKRYDAMAAELDRLRNNASEYVALKESKSVFDRLKEQLEGEVNSLTAARNTLEDENEQLRNKIYDLERSSRDASNLKAKLVDYEKLKMEHLNLERETEELRAYLASLSLDELMAKVKKYESDEAELDKQRASELDLLRDQLRQEREKVRALEKSRAEYDALQISYQQVVGERDLQARKGEALRGDLSRLGPLEDEVAQLRAKVAKMAALDSELASLRQQAAEGGNTRIELDSLKRKLASCDAERKTLAAETTQLQADLSTLRASNDLLAGKYAALNSSKDALELENADLNGKVKRGEQTATELVRLRNNALELITVKADNDSLKRKLAKLESERTSLQAELAQLTGSVESLNSQVSALSSQNASLAATRKHLEEELDEANAKVRQLEGSMNQRAMESRNAGTEASRLKVELDALQGKFAKLQGDNASLVQQVSGAKENAIQAAALKVENEGLHAELSMQKAQQAALKSRMAQLEPLESEMSTLRSTMTVTQTSQQRDLSGLKANNESLERKVAQLEGEKRGLDAEKRTLASQLADLQKENEDLRVKAAAKPAKKKGGKFAFESDEVGDVGGEHPRLSSWAPPDLSEGLTFESEEIVLDLGSGEPPRLSAIPEAISPKTDELETERAARKAADDARNHAEAEAQRLRDELELHNRTYHNNTVHEELAALEHSLERERGYRMLAEQRALLLEAIETPWAPTGFHPDQLPKLTQILSDEGLKSHGHGHMLSKNDLVALFAPYFEKEPAYVNVQPVPTPVLRPMPSPQTMTLVPVSPRPLAYYTSPARTLQRNQLADFFDVQVLEGPVAARLNLLGRYRCRIAPADISLLNPHTSSLVHSWPVEAIRNFGSQDGVFFFETTHGEVSFASPWADDIYFTTQKFFA